MEEVGAEIPLGGGPMRLTGVGLTNQYLGKLVNLFDPSEKRNARVELDKNTLENPAPIQRAMG